MSLYQGQRFLSTLATPFSYWVQEPPSSTYFFRPKGGKILTAVISARSATALTHILFSKPTPPLNIVPFLNSPQLCSSGMRFPDDKADTERITRNTWPLLTGCPWMAEVESHIKCKKQRPCLYKLKLKFERKS